MHTSSSAESYFHRAVITDIPVAVLIHGHTSGPFVRPAYGLNLTIFSSGECHIEALSLTIDWWTSLGRWGARYWGAAFSWSIGIVAIMSVKAFAAWDSRAVGEGTHFSMLPLKLQFTLLLSRSQYALSIFDRIIPPVCGQRLLTAGCCAFRDVFVAPPANSTPWE